jgi:thiol-disulfide isomerase/thioredoxin
MRKALLIVIMLSGISLVVWSGYQNRKRREAALSPQNRVTLVRENASSTASSDSPVAASPLRGKPAPAFTLVDLDGKKVSLSDFHGHPLVVNFWGTYCGPCKFEMPWLEEFSHKYASDGFKVVGVTYDAEVGAPTISKDIHKLGVTYPILLSTPKAEKDYLSDSEVLPMSFYVDKSGKVVEVTAGLGSKDQLESMVKETIASGGSGS